MRRDQLDRRLVVLGLASIVIASVGFQPRTAHGGGVFGIDHRVNQDESGVWARNNQKALGYAVVLSAVAGGVYYGRDSELGRVSWQSVDAMAISGLGAQALKYATARERPSKTSDPNQWFSGHNNLSFPSGEVTLQAAFVTPFIVHYQSDPWVWALEALPAYMGVARVKSRGHWQSDVLAGWALGSAVGYWTATRSASPFSVRILPNAVTIGWRRDF